MKVCYFIQSHKNPEQVCRLVRAIEQSSPRAHVLIHHDFSTSYLNLNGFSGFSNIDLIKRTKAARRGDASVLEIYLDGIDWLFKQNIEFDWLICLSGQDYPTQPISAIENFLAQTEYDGFIRYHDLLAGESLWLRKNRQRYFAQYIHLPEATSRVLKKTSQIVNRYTPLIVKGEYSVVGLENYTLFNEEFRCYRGWYWNTLSKKCLKFLKDYLQENPELLKYYKATIAPEESLIQTVLVNSKRFNLCNDDKRYCQYPTQLKGYAKTLTVEDYPNLISGDFHFARKFDVDRDSAILDLLDKRILSSSLILN